MFSVLVMMISPFMAGEEPRIENIQKIENDFKPIQVIKLEQNYRSTGNILSASNALIANNQNRLEKSLWTESGDGDLDQCI